MIDEALLLAQRREQPARLPAEDRDEHLERRAAVIPDRDAGPREHGVGLFARTTDPDRLEIPARSIDESRTQVIGRIGKLVWSAFVTRRGDRIRGVAPQPLVCFGIEQHVW